MRSSFLTALIATILFGGGYFYYIAQAVCPTPLEYSLGSIDERFNMTKDEARIVISEAESVWENATGRNLFSYSDDGKLTVNFLFDDRQQFINAEGVLKQKLDATENISDALKTTHADLVSEYEKLKETYTTEAKKYEQKLLAYNTEVEKYNKQGGAPQDVYASLEKQKRALDKEQSSLNALSSQLNRLVVQINNIGEKGNSIIATYNNGVTAFNKTYGEPREFTQGDYSNNTVKIYTFKDKEELKLVLVHELGHALSLDHVEGNESAMYYLIGKQPQELVLSDADLQEFGRICGEKSIFEKMKLSVLSGFKGE
jgi:hypothetical protein